MSEEELVAEVGVLMIAGSYIHFLFFFSFHFRKIHTGLGSDTTALAMTAAFFYLAQHPSALGRLRAELQQAFDSRENIRVGSALSSCVYLRACLDEAMRLVPAVGGILPRTVLPPGLTIANEYFPAGTIVGVPGYAMHRNAEYFPEPFAFRPERWLADNEADADADVLRRSSHAAFLQFSQGPRGCVGKHLAYAEMSLAVASVVWSFDLEVSAQYDQNSGADDDDWRAAMASRGEIPTSDMFVSHPVSGPFLRFRWNE